MAYIDPSQVRPKFTSSIVANYMIGNSPTNLLGSKFKPVSKRTLYLEWNVKRVGETVATDVVRGADGNLNTFQNMTRKIEQPPYFYEKINVTQVAGYDRAFPDSGKIDESAYNDFRTNMMAEIENTQFKIDRSRELMAREVLLLGTVTTRVNGTTDFNRNVASILPYDASIDWTQATVDPRNVIEQMCVYERTYGQSSDAEFDLYVGSAAYNALINNPIIVNTEKYHVNELTAADVARTPQGACLMKILNCGSFRVRVITYPQFYTPYGVTDLTGASKVPYIPANAIILTPATPMFITGYTVPPMLPSELLAGMPSGFTGGRVGSIDGRYYIGEYLDVARRGWYVTMETCFLTIPIAVDDIVTAYVTPA